MLTRKNLNILLSDIPTQLSNLGIDVDRMILFGSYVKGNIHGNSDVDIAIWSPQFSGFGLQDLELYRPLLRKYPQLDLKTFASGQDSNHNPFIDVIEKTGVEILLYEEETGFK
jgi:uncharacterized protein